MTIIRYIDAVKPGKYGTPRPFYFPFLPSYWCGKRPVKVRRYMYMYIYVYMYMYIYVYMCMYMMLTAISKTFMNIASVHWDS